MTFTLHTRLFIYLIFGFIFTTIIGTVTHELGHIAIAKRMGYTPSLHYGFMNYTSEKHDKLENYYDLHKKQIQTPGTIESKQFKKMYDNVENESFLVTLGGPTQTMVTGTLGFLMIWFNRKSIKAQLTFLQWAFVFLAFFWSRQIFNFIFSYVAYIVNGKFSSGGDEPRISRYLEIPQWSFGLITATIAAILLGYVTFVLIPKQQRFTFIAAGIAGSGIGFILWMEVLGPVILP